MILDIPNWITAMRCVFSLPSSAVAGGGATEYKGCDLHDSLTLYLLIAFPFRCDVNPQPYNI